MNQIAKFEKVSYEQFKKDWLASDPALKAALDTAPESEKTGLLNAIFGIYCKIRLPERATEGSAGYDFFLPINLHMEPGKTYKFPTGIRCQIDQGWVLTLFPKSGLSFKCGTKFLNVIPVIDSDYYNSDNEGHILMGMTVDQMVDFTAGQKIAQGVFLPFGITTDDNVKEKRNGGFGSTGE